MPHKTIESPFTFKDIRYTTKGEYLYAFVLDWPGKRTVEMQFLAPGNHRIGETRREITEVLISGHEVCFARHGDHAGAARELRKALAHDGPAFPEADEARALLADGDVASRRAAIWFLAQEDGEGQPAILGQLLATAREDLAAHPPGSAALRRAMADWY